MSTISRHSHFYDLLEALAEPGCPLCSLVARTRWRYLDNLAYENVNDPGVREKLRTSLGFCNRHAWYFMVRVRETFGAAIIYRDLLHTIQHRAATAVPDAVIASRPCLACVVERQASGDVIHTLAEAIDEADLRAAYVASDGLCAPHFRMATTLMNVGTRAKLLELTMEIWDGPMADPRRLRRLAAGAPQTTGVDQAALTGGEAQAPAVHLPSPQPFVCAVCAAVRSDLATFTSWNEIDNGQGGICNVHAWLPAGQDVEEIYRRQVAAVREEAAAHLMATDSRLTQAMRGLGLSRPSSDPPGSPLRCLACARQGLIEDALCAVAPAPLCVPHLRRAMQQERTNILEPMRPTWHDLDHLLGEYLRKEDYRFRGEPRGTEQSSPRWAMALIAGESGVR